MDSARANGKDGERKQSSVDGALANNASNASCTPQEANGFGIWEQSENVGGFQGSWNDDTLFLRPAHNSDRRYNRLFCWAVSTKADAKRYWRRIGNGHCFSFCKFSAEASVRKSR